MGIPGRMSCSDEHLQQVFNDAKVKFFTKSMKTHTDSIDFFDPGRRVTSKQSHRGYSYLVMVAVI